ncbi:MAG: SufS family cysteine desulfurase [Paludibacteraceae bacterium]|nr:SufS family cysteine desulfurase [Paludibacteraceae bacterium]
MRKEDFPILSKKIYGRQLVYLDNAATTQKPQAMLDAINFAYSDFNSNIHRGVHHLSQVATANHEQARRKVADFIGAKSAEEIIFTKGTTDSLNMLAFCFGETFISEGDEIIISSVEHHSNIVPWQMMCKRKKAVLKVIPLKNDLTLDLDKYVGLLSERTKLVSIADVSNVLGTESDLSFIIGQAHQRNIAVCVDAAQSVAHKKIDVGALDCDFLAFSAHKIYSPNGIGILYGKKYWLQQLTPYQGGGEMIEHVSFENTTYNILPYKFEAGTPNYIGSYAFAKTLEYLESVGLEQIFEHENSLSQYAEKKLENIEGVKIYAAGQEKKGVISFNVYNKGQLIHPYDIGMLLDKQGVAVRTGHHCAEPLTRLLGVSGTVRISLALYNDRNDIDIFIQGLKRAIAMLE